MRDRPPLTVTNMAARRGVDPALSLKRSIAGRRGAQARWGSPVANHGTHQAEHAAPANGNPACWWRMARPDQDGPAVIDLYGEIGWDIDATMLVQALRSLDTDRIEVHVNSPGGDVYDGIAIYTALVDHSAHVTVRVDGLAASAASFIAQAGNRVEIAPNAEIMIHDGWMLTIGNAADHRRSADDLDRTSDNIAGLFAERTGRGSTKSWRRLMEAETWFSADEAVEAGLADAKVKVGRRRGEPAPENRYWPEVLAQYRYGGRSQAPPPELLSPHGTAETAELHSGGIVVSPAGTGLGGTVDITDIVRNAVGRSPSGAAEHAAPPPADPGAVAVAVPPPTVPYRPPVAPADVLAAVGTSPTAPAPPPARPPGDPDVAAVAVEASTPPPPPPPPPPGPAVDAETVLASVMAAANVPGPEPDPEPTERDYVEEARQARIKELLSS